MVSLEQFLARHYAGENHARKQEGHAMRVTVETQRAFAGGADHIWKITGDFGGLKEWLPGSLACRVEAKGISADAGYVHCHPAGRRSLPHRLEGLLARG